MNAPQIRRDAWSRHPHYPSQVLLLGSHESFRAVSQTLVEASKTGADRRASVAAIGLLFRRWIAAMRSHEAYEEHKLYPYLAARWEVSFEVAEQGHHALHRAHDDVIGALEGARDQSGRDALTAALKAHDAILLAHLELEEDMVIPLLLELSESEFDRFRRSSLRALLANLNRRDADAV